MRARATEVWLSVSAWMRRTWSKGTEEKRRTVSVGPSQPIMPAGMRTRSELGLGLGRAASMTEARARSTSPVVKHVDQREGTAAERARLGELVKMPSMSGAVLR